VQVGALSSEVVGPWLGSKLMKPNPLVPLYIGYAISFAGCALFAFMPETLKLRPTRPLEDEELPSDAETPDEDLVDGKPGWKAWAHKHYRRIHAATSIFHSRPLVTLLLCFALAPVANEFYNYVPRILSARFGWELADAGIVVSLRGTLNFFVLLFLLPAVSSFLTRKPTRAVEEQGQDGGRFRRPWNYGLGWSIAKKDFVLALSCLSFYLLATVLLSTSPPLPLYIASMMIWTIGAGFMPVLRGLITSLVDEKHMGRLYATISMVEMSGSIMGGPVFAKLYGVGLRVGDPWRSLVFTAMAACVAAGIAAIASVGVSVVKKGDGESEDHAETIGEQGRV
jgi:hypothetical protein